MNGQRSANPSGPSSPVQRPAPRPPESAAAGDELEPLVVGPLTRETFRAYGIAAGDRHPVHHDDEAARAAGMPAVFAQGMLVMAYLGRVLTNWVAQDAIRSFHIRFCAVVWVGERLRCEGRIVERKEADDEIHLEVQLSAYNEQSQLKATGGAHVVVASPGGIPRSGAR